MVTVSPFPSIISSSCVLRTLISLFPEPRESHLHNINVRLRGKEWRNEGARSAEGFVKRGRTNRQTDSKRGLLHGKSLDTTLVSLWYFAFVSYSTALFTTVACTFGLASTRISFENFSQRFTPPSPDKLFLHLLPSLSPRDFWLLTFDFWISREYWTQREILLSRFNPPSPPEQPSAWQHFMASKVENTTKTIFFLSGELLMLFCVLRRVPK